MSIPASRRWSDDGREPGSDYWVDPLPAVQGLLSADSIRRYQALVDLVHPWDPTRLGPASYELTVGPEFLVGQQAGLATPDDPWIDIPPNALVFVSMMERIRLPLYLSARFDLHISFIYRGLLLGTGPQVDPGFRGVLSCPIHNITNESVRLRLGDAFAKMEFLKISPLVGPDHADGLRDCASFAAVQTWTKQPRTGDGPTLPLIDPAKLWREPIFGYVGDRRVSSSVKGLEERVEEAEKVVGRFEILGFFGIFALLGIAIALVALNFTYVDGKVEPLAKQTTVKEQQRTVDAALRRASAGAARTRALESDVRRLERQVRRLSP